MWHPSNLPFTSSPLIYTYGVLLDTDVDLAVLLKRIVIIRYSFVLAQALKIQVLDPSKAQEVMKRLEPPALCRVHGFPQDALGIIGVRGRACRKLVMDGQDDN